MRCRWSLQMLERWLGLSLLLAVFGLWGCGPLAVEFVNSGEAYYDDAYGNDEDSSDADGDEDSEADSDGDGDGDDSGSTDGGDGSDDSGTDDGGDTDTGGGGGGGDAGDNAGGDDSNGDNGGNGGNGGGGDGNVPEGWLFTSGNRIYQANGEVWQARGANIHDTRSCNACAYTQPDVNEVLRRVDLLVDDWGANFMRLTLESHGSAGGRVHWRGLLDDADYMEDIRTIVDHIGTKPGVYVMVSLWVDPSFTDMGWPTAGTQVVWQRLAEEFRNDSHVLFGLVNEPEMNFSGGQDPDVWLAMNDTVQAIRDVEDSFGTPHHIVAVQGTGGWSRRLGYYVNNPITAEGGDNVAYEVHVYDPQSSFQSMFVNYSATLPIIIGEYGPAAGFMTEVDSDVLMVTAEAHDIPYLAWTFHMRCPPNLLVDNSGGGCGIGMNLEPTSWGSLLMSRLAKPWGAP